MQCEGPWTPAMRRYLLRLAVSMTIYMVFLFVAVRAFKGPTPPAGVMAVVLAILPALPILGVFWAIGRLIVETKDEYQRMLFVKQSLIATGLTLSIVTVWGFLENFDQVSHAPGFYVAVLWFAMLGVGGAVTRFRP